MNFLFEGGVGWDDLVGFYDGSGHGGEADASGDTFAGDEAQGSTAGVYAFVAYRNFDGLAV